MVTKVGTLDGRDVGSSVHAVGREVGRDVGASSLAIAILSWNNGLKSIRLCEEDTGAAAASSGCNKCTALVPCNITVDRWV